MHKRETKLLKQLENCKNLHFHSLSQPLNPLLITLFCLWIMSINSVFQQQQKKVVFRTVCRVIIILCFGFRRLGVKTFEVADPFALPPPCDWLHLFVSLFTCGLTFRAYWFLAKQLTAELQLVNERAVLLLQSLDQQPLNPSLCSTGHINQPLLPPPAAGF